MLKATVCNSALWIVFVFFLFGFQRNRPASALGHHKSAEAPAWLARWLRNDGVDNVSYFWVVCTAVPSFMQPP